MKPSSRASSWPPRAAAPGLATTQLSKSQDPRDRASARREPQPGRHGLMAQ